jgi:hypothetical protein
MPVEVEGTVTVHGNPEVDMQAALDLTFDTEVTVPAGATHAEVHRGSAPWQRLWWSVTGLPGEWNPIQEPSRYPMGPLRIAMGPATDFYLRKPYNPRTFSSRTDMAALYPGDIRGQADDRVVEIVVSFTQD